MAGPKFETAGTAGGEDGLSDCQLAALLVRKPWNLRLWEIRSLTDWEILNVYFRPGEQKEAEEGMYWPVKDKDKAKDSQKWVSFEEMFRSRLKPFRLTAEQIERRWQAYLIRNPGLRRG